MLRSCGNSSPRYCRQSTAPRLHAALGQQLPEPPDLTRRCVPLQRRHSSPWHLSCVCRIPTCSSLLRRRTMRTLQRATAALIYPAILCLGVACERTDTPTGAQPRAGALQLSNDPTTRWVNDDDPNGGGYAFPDPGTSCENPGYQKIQDAVNAAAAGDRINVCPGTYSEQVTIAQDNIQLRSVRRWDAVIKAPLIMVPYSVNNPKFVIVRIAGAHNLTILAFTIPAPGQRDVGSVHYGVRVDNGRSANILG